MSLLAQRQSRLGILPDTPVHCGTYLSTDAAHHYTGRKQGKVQPMLRSLRTCKAEVARPDDVADRGGLPK